MRLTDSLKKYVTSLKEVSVVNGDNLYFVCIEIAKSNYPNKQFTIGTLLAEVCGLGAKLWSSHLTTVFKVHPEYLETREALAEFFGKYYTTVENFEKAMRAEFGVPVTDADL